MTDFESSTDQVKKETLESSIQTVMWGRPVASPGETVNLKVYLQFVGNGSKIEIEVVDHEGKKHFKHKGTTLEGLYTLEFEVPEKAEESLQANVKLPKHGLKGESGLLKLNPLVKVTNAKWDREAARRGEAVGLSADVEGAQEGADAVIEIYEHDQDDAHDQVTVIPTVVKDGKVATEWEFEYIEDTDDIPDDEEAERGYNPPEYFFRVRVGGGVAESGLLEFKDLFEVTLTDEEGNPIGNEDYVLHLPDGKKVEGKLDESGYACEEDIPPGPVTIEFPNQEILVVQDEA